LSKHTEGNREQMLLFTIGHSTRTFQEFSALLTEWRIEVLADVRSWPSSTRNPQFSREALKESLEGEGITYVWLGRELGGFRKEGLGRKSPNKAWKTAGFRNYADYTMSDEFRNGVEKLLSIAEKRRVTFMCAEKFYWRCHRRIISDYLKVQGHQVIHIVEEGRSVEHQLSGFARVKNGKLTYPLPHQDSAPARRSAC
jgi:uncharacterized protein (DUF488 family)